MNFRLAAQRLISTLLLQALCLACFSVNAEQVVTSPNDQRQYEYLELPNRLKVLLISDPATDKAAASLDVYAGSRDDPEGREGLAHFLEHMLFLGTEKYPEAGEYQAYISARGGSHNAYTSFEHTNYFFDVDKDSLEPALDRFSQFFVAPLFTAEYVSREKNAVHSEYQAKLKDDGRRAYSVLKQAVNPAHPFSNFSVGSLDTLADREGSTVRDELLKFYQAHYSANQMALVILGHESLEQLKQWATEKFSAIADRNIQRKTYPQPILSEAQTPVRLNMIPLKDERMLQMMFQMPASRPHYHTKPASYIGHLLGHEGPGSLLSLLKNKGWSDGLSAGLSMDTTSQSLFSITVKLTNEGLQHVDDIVEHSFQYLKLIREQGIKAWSFDEVAKIAEMEFRFLEKSQPIHYVSSLSSHMHVYPASDLIRSAYLYDKFDAELIQRFMQSMRPEGMLLSVMSQGLETDKKDPWYDADYSLRPITTAQLQRWSTTQVDAALKLPEPNDLIAEDLSLKTVTGQQDKPQRILSRDGLTVWHQQDDSFKLPKADFYFSLRSPAANASLANRVKTELYSRLVTDQLNEYGYQAKLAGLNYSIYSHIRGIGVRISGFNDKQTVLLKKIVGTLSSPQFSDERFALIREDMQRELENYKRKRPYHQAYAEIGKLLLQPHWTEAQQLQALKVISAQDLRDFVPQLLGKLDVVALSHGNALANETLELVDILNAELLANSKPTSVNDGNVVKLKAGENLLRDLAIDHPDSVYTLYLQAADRNLRNRATISLLTQILDAPFYSDLRTEKQLGYIVFSNPVSLLEVPGVMFLIQSPVADPATLHGHVTDFLQGFSKTMQEMSAKEFEEHRQAVLTRLLEEEKNLQQRTGRYWNEIDMQYEDFDSREQLATEIRALSAKDVQQAYRELLLSDDSRRLMINTTGTRFKTDNRISIENLKTIESAEQVREGHEVYPRIAPTGT